MSSSEINQVDADRLCHLWDLIQQTNTLCDVMRTATTILRQEATEITTEAMAKLEETISKKKYRPKKK